MYIRIFLGIILISGLTGCASTGRKSDTDMLQSRVVDLEKKLEAKDSEIVDLQYEVKDLSSKVDSKNAVAAPVAAEPDASGPVLVKGSMDIIRANTTALKVQTALKNAGYYAGKLDGKIGPGTKAAVIAFQRAQGLSADGVVGRKTWEALKQHLK